MILPNSTLMQLTYFDNGLPIKNVRTLKTANGKGVNMPQHMITIAGWTATKNIKFSNTDYKTSVILIPHRLFKKRVSNWNNISDQYREDLNYLHDQNENSSDKMRLERTWYGPVFNKDSGQNYIDGQFIEVCMDQGTIFDATLFQNGNAIQINNWVDYNPNKSKLEAPAKCIARIDLAGLNFANWATQ